MNIKHTVHVLHSKIREAIKANTRSPKWRALEKKVREEQGSCAACKSTKNLQVHHKQPFHLHPELELIEDNLICLCMDRNECHLKIGHGDNFKAYNPNAEADAKEFFNATFENREAIQARALANRKTLP